MTISNPVAGSPSDSPELDRLPVIIPSGFREYDARWWFGHPSSNAEPDLNLAGVTSLGMGLGTLLWEMGAGPDIVTGHDYRSYSQSVKEALISGLMAAGARVTDIGLALSPTAYFAQFELGISSVAMITASHNPNGWTGVKMGVNPPLTFGPQEMARLKDIVLNQRWKLKEGGTCNTIEGFAERYISDLANRPKFKRKIRAVVACGNGTAGAFAPEVLTRLGIEVIPTDCVLDYNFPNYHPDPENINMLHAMAKAVRNYRADIAFGFDGDGDRCGFVDNEGREILADKMGVLLARDLANRHDNRKFVVDIKSTELFQSDPVLKALGATTDYFKSGHSHIKKRMQEIGAIAGFEKSGHIFFNPPIGRGYDDAILAAIAVCELLDRNPSLTMANLRNSLPVTFDAPPFAFPCSDHEKYKVMKAILAKFKGMLAHGESFGGQKIRELVTVNGVRVICSDGTWGLIRASSNEPKLVVVVESPVSLKRRDEMLQAVDSFLQDYPAVGPRKT